MAKSSTPSPEARKTGGMKTARPKIRGEAQFSYEQIAVRAYEIYVRRCQTNQPGDAIGDWAAAEAELRAAQQARAVQPDAGRPQPAPPKPVAASGVSDTPEEQ